MVGNKKLVEQIMDKTGYDYATVYNIIAEFSNIAKDSLKSNKKFQIRDICTLKPDNEKGVVVYINKNLKKEVMCNEKQL